MRTKRIDVNFGFDVPLPDGKMLRRGARWLLPSPGNALFTLLVVSALIWVQMAGAAPWAQSLLQTGGSSSTTINYQGRLADSGGVPIEGNVGMEFALYDAQTGGNLLWGPETHGAVPVSDGLFSVKLGSQTDGGIPASILGGDVWLEVTVGGETLTPRERLGAVPYALQALTVPDGAIGSRQLAPNWYKNSIASEISSTSTEFVTTGNQIDFTCENDCTALILHRGLVAHSVANGRVDVGIDVDGEREISELGVPNVAKGGGGAPDWHQVSGFDFVNLSAGTHTVEVKFRCTTPGTCYYYNSLGDWEHLSILTFAQQ